MTVPRRRFLAMGAASVLASRLFAQDGYTPLFDGRSLDGWTIREGPESAFYVRDGAIVVHPGSNYPAWLRSRREYENFDLRLEFFLQGWMDSGVFLHAPEHGRPTYAGFNIKLSHKNDNPPLPESLGAVFPLVAPSKVVVRPKGEWNTLRVVMDWPKLQVWTNEEKVQDLDVETVPELRYRLRSGYLGLQSLSYPIRFRNIRVRELPSREKWTVLYGSPADLEAQWFIAEQTKTTKFETLGPVLRADGIGYLATKQKFRDFELRCYIRASRFSNGGIIFRTATEDPRSEHYEIQLHDVEDAFYPTGSLYGIERSTYPRIEPEKWYLFQLRVKDRECLVRIDGQTVMEHHDLKRLNPGHVMLQAHDAVKWIEYQDIRIKPA